MMFDPQLKGRSRSVEQLVSTTQNNMVAFSDFIRISSGTGITISGIVSSGEERTVTFLNNSGSTVTFTHASGNSYLGNRFLLPGAASFNLLDGGAVSFRWSPSQKYWNFVSKKFSILPSSIGTETAGVYTMNQATAFVNGYLSAADFTGFSNRPTKDSGPSAGAVTFWTSATNLSGRELAFSWNDTLKQLGVGVSSSLSAGKGHFKSDEGQITADASAMTAAITQFILPIDYATYGVTEVGADLPAPSSNAADINYAGTGYTADNHTYTYRIIPGYDDGSTTTWCAGYSDTAPDTDDGSTNPYSIDLSWASTAGNVAPNKWVVLRDIDGGGFGHYIITLTPSLADDNTGWTATPFDATPTYSDFVAAGQTYNYAAGIYKNTPASTRCYGATPATASFTDASNNGHTFKLLHTVTGGTGDSNKFVKDGATINEGASSTFTESTNTFSAGSAALTPTTFGYLSNGSNLNIDFHYYATSVISGVTVFAVTPFDASTVDPNDGNYYYVTLNGFTPSTGKIIKNAFASAKTVSASTYYDYSGSFADSTGVSPNALYVPAHYTEGRSDTTNLQPHAIHKYLTAATGQVYESYRNQDDVEVGYIKAGAAFFRVGGAGGTYTDYSSTSQTADTTASTWRVFSASPTIDATTLGVLSFSGTEIARWDSTLLKASKGMAHAYVSKTANYTLTHSDYCVAALSGTFDMTLPTAIGYTGQVFVLKNLGTGVVTVKTTSSQLIDGQASGAITLTQYQSITVISSNADWVII